MSVQTVTNIGMRKSYSTIVYGHTEMEYIFNDIRFDQYFFAHVEIGKHFRHEWEGMVKQNGTKWLFGFKKTLKHKPRLLELY